MPYEDVSGGQDTFVSDGIAPVPQADGDSTPPVEVSADKAPVAPREASRRRENGGYSFDQSVF